MIQNRASNIVRQGSVAVIVATFFSVSCNSARFNEARSDRRQDHIAGPAQSVRLEVSKLVRQGGGYIEGPREVVVTRVYDVNGNVTEERHTTSAGEPLYNVRYTYDGNGRRTERVIADPKGATKGRREFKPGNKSGDEEWVEYDSEGSVRASGEDLYDGERRLIESALFNGKGAMTDRWTYSYDEKGNRKEESRYFADNTIDTRYDYEFDDKGNRTGVTKYNARGEVSGKESYGYEFDANGNWIKQTITRTIEDTRGVSTEPVEVSYRTITYK